MKFPDLFLTFSWQSPNFYWLFAAWKYDILTFAGIHTAHTDEKKSYCSDHLEKKTWTPAFWGYPPAASWLPTPLSHIGSQVKRRQGQSYKFKEFAKIANLLILIKTLHMTHLLKLFNKMCKYEMDPMSIVEDTEQTRFCPQTDGQTDRRTDKVKPVYPPFNFVEAGGIISMICHFMCCTN